VAVKRFLAQDKWKPKDYEAFCAEASHLLTLRCARAQATLPINRFTPTHPQVCTCTSYSTHK
jgi:hypothetical protein